MCKNNLSFCNAGGSDFDVGATLNLNPLLILSRNEWQSLRYKNPPGFNGLVLQTKPHDFEV